jgi:elongation factor Ts
MLSSFLTARPIARVALREMRCLSYKPDIEAVKKLRQASEAPLKDVKNALVATEGDFPAAFEWLRKKGIARASAKAGRTTAQGLIGVHVQGKTGAMVEINSETDFVAMNDKFQELVAQVAKALAESGDAQQPQLTTELDAESFGKVAVDGETVADKVPELVGKVGENVVARRAVKFAVAEGTICSYLHNQAANGLGRSGALVALEYPSSTATSEQTEAVELLGRRLAMHIVAAKPKYLSRDAVPAAIVEKERAFQAEQVQNTGKPANIVAKMIDGRLGKFFGEFALLEQQHFIEEGNPKVGEFVEAASKKIGVNVTVAAFQRFEIGEVNDDEPQQASA